MNSLIVLNKNDNVGVSQFIIPEKTKINGQEISTIDPIPFGHKVCLKPINKGDPIIKYDQIIGFASKNITAGEHVHSHNLEFKEFDREFQVKNKKTIVDEKVDTFFNGILRDNGQVATRNYIGIVSTVNCSATVTKMIVEKIKYSVNPKIIKTVIMIFSFLDNLKGTRSIIGFLASFFFSSFLKFKFIKKYTAIRNKDNDRSKNIESSPK